MVIIYDKNTKDIVSFESNTMAPQLPANMTIDEQKQYYDNLEQGIISIPYEMGAYVNDFNLCFDSNGNFTGLQPRGAL
jgi:hypothetical protein